MSREPLPPLAWRVAGAVDAEELARRVDGTAAAAGSVSVHAGRDVDWLDARRQASLLRLPTRGFTSPCCSNCALRPLTAGRATVARAPGGFVRRRP